MARTKCAQGDVIVRSHSRCCGDPFGINPWDCFKYLCEPGYFPLDRSKHLQSARSDGGCATRFGSWLVRDVCPRCSRHSSATDGCIAHEVVAIAQRSSLQSWTNSTNSALNSSATEKLSTLLERWAECSSQLSGALPNWRRTSWSKGQKAGCEGQSLKDGGCENARPINHSG